MSNDIKDQRGYISINESHKSVDSSFNSIVFSSTPEDLKRTSSMKLINKIWFTLGIIFIVLCELLFIWAIWNK